MGLDTKEGCQGCGILFASVCKGGKKGIELCRACRCMEETTSQTPCGQCYCKTCGILVDSTRPGRREADYCPACTLQRNTLVQGRNFSEASAACKCEFCSNHYDISPPASKLLKLSLEPTSKNTAPKGNQSAHEIPGAHEVIQNQREDLMDFALRERWEREQVKLTSMLVKQDSSKVKKILQAIKSRDTSKTFYIGGVDISFIKDNNVDACAALIVISFPDLKVVYKRLEMIQLTAPYIPGFLAFREVDSLISLYKTMMKNAPQYKPDVILVDGNGCLHPRGFGLACHLGVMLGVPCVGVAKTLIHVDGIEDNAEHKAKKQSLKSEGDTFPLTTNGGVTLGVALRSTRSSSNPVYVSVGHRISLQSAITLVQHCSKYRIPEPTRFADLYSRQYLMDKKQDPEELIVRSGESAPSEWQ